MNQILTVVSLVLLAAFSYADLGGDSLAKAIIKMDTCVGVKNATGYIFSFKSNGEVYVSYDNEDEYSHSEATEVDSHSHGDSVELVDSHSYEDEDSHTYADQVNNSKWFVEGSRLYIVGIGGSDDTFDIIVGLKSKTCWFK